MVLVILVLVAVGAGAVCLLRPDRWMSRAAVTTDAHDEPPGDVSPPTPPTPPRCMAEAAAHLREERAAGGTALPSEPPRPTVPSKAEDSAERLAARIDPLTRLPNRLAFDEELAGLQARVDGGGSAILLLVDIDHFRHFNDRHGMPVGDRLLQHVAGVIRDSARLLDIVASRYDGGQFALIDNGSSFGMAQRLGEDLRAAVESSPLKHEGQSLQITISLGLAGTQPGLPIETVLHRAEQALRTAKAAGRNGCYFHDGHQCLPVTEELLSRFPRRLSSLAEPQGTSERQRRQTRKTYQRVHAIAPFAGGTMPAPEMFFEAQFMDISSGGFSMMLHEQPPPGDLVVVLDGAGEKLYVTATIVRVRRMAETTPDGRPLFEIGCRFTGKLNETELSRV